MFPDNYAMYADAVQSATATDGAGNPAPFEASNAIDGISDPNPANGYCSMTLVRRYNALLYFLW